MHTELSLAEMKLLLLLLIKIISCHQHIDRPLRLVILYEHITFCDLMYCKGQRLLHILLELTCFLSFSWVHVIQSNYLFRMQSTLYDSLKCFRYDEHSLWFEVKQMFKDCKHLSVQDKVMAEVLQEAAYYKHWKKQSWLERQVCESSAGCSTSLFWPAETRQMESENRESEVKQGMHNENLLWLHLSYLEPITHKSSFPKVCRPTFN